MPRSGGHFYETVWSLTMWKTMLTWLPSRRWLIVPPILVGMACVAGFAMSKKELTTVDTPEQALLLPAVRIERQDVLPWAIGFGTAEPARIWSAITEIKGRIVETHPSLDSGKPIGASKLLLKIDDSDYQLRLSQRQADLSSMKAKLAELEASKVADEISLGLAVKLEAIATDELERMLSLKENNAVSISEVDSARTQQLQQSQFVQNLRNSLSLLPSRIASANASIAIVESQIKEAVRDIERTSIFSPFAGVLSGVNLEPGQIVGVNQQLFEIRDNGVIEIESQFSLSQLEKVSPRLKSRIRSLSPTAVLNAADADLLEGLTVKVTVRSGDLVHRWDGKAIRISESIDQQTRTLGIVIQVDNLAKVTTVSDKESKVDTRQTYIDPVEPRAPGPMLRAGSFCEVTLEGRQLSDVILVPRTAIDGDVVYIIDDQKRLKMQPVKVGFTIGEDVCIDSGLKAGDVVATTFPVPAIEGKLIEPKYVDQMDDPKQADDSVQNTAGQSP